jgi:serine phosphatase RsbU (regulator of sigma subunit)
MDGRSKFAARKSIFILFLLILFLQGKLLAQVGFYWEQPEIFSAKGSFPVSASNGEFSVIAWQESSGSDSASEGDGRISISLGIKIAGEEWQLRRNIGEPFTYSGTEPSILSIALDHEGRIIIAVAVSTTQTEILISGDQGKNFSRYWIDSGNENSVAPRIVVRSDGGYLLFVTRSFEASLSIYYSRSDDGINWTPFELFVDDAGLQLNFLPTHAANGSFDYVVFQSFVAGSGGAIPSFQLFIKMSYDGCKTWTQSRRLTTFRDPVSNTSAEPERFDNQRPHLIPYGDWLFLVWERRFGTGSPQIYSAILDTGANIIGQANRVNNINAYCNYPVAFLYQGSPMVVWFDNRRGSNRAFLAQQTGAGIGGGNWQNYDLSGNVGDTSFARPMVNGDDLYVFWQITSRGGQRAPETSRIYYLLPDTSVNPPLLAAQNFIPSRRGRGERVRLSWTADDPSGIAGFAWLWSRNENEDPPRELMIHTDTAAIQTSGAAINTPGASSFMDVNALDDGSWYFSLIAQDFAGNWSSPARIEYIRDTTPPPAATIIFPEIDERGFLLSNTFSLKWNPPPASDIAGYTWELQYMGSAAGFPGNLMGEDFNSAAAEHFSRSVSLTPRIIGPVTIASYVNQDNGIWRFTVAAIDEVGNVGPQSSLFFKTDKYIPHTYVTYVDANQDEQGILSIHIIGRGFSNGGNVSRIFLDQDGAPPYDKEFIFSRGDYQVNSDREITGLQIEDISEGTYRLVLEHPLRGLHITGSIVTADKIGTVKFGDFSRAWEASWRIRKAYRFMLEPGLLIIFAILVLCVIGLFASVRGLGNVIADSAAVRIEAAALLTGDFMPLEKKRRLVKIKRRGIGLRLKLASFTVALVLLVVAMVSAPLYYMMTVTQRETLLQGLWDRSTVLLEGLASSARAYMPSGNVLELGFLPAQTAAIPEARYITITGYSSTTIFDDHVWATNDPDILSKIDTAEFQPGISRLNDILSSRLEEINRNLNERARTEVGSLSQSITQMTQEAISLALHTDPESRQRLRDIQVTTRSLETRLTERLTEIAREIGSEPAFSTENLSPDGNRSFIFFKPVMYRHGAEDTYLRGLIRLEVSIDAIINEIAEGQRSLLEVILLIALAAIIIGTIGALILSMVIIRPIRRLVSHVEQIRDTEDKSKLEGVEIAIKTRDEIAVLGNTINDMTHGLVKAAAAASDLSIGKEIQKKFIPLELDRNGNKLSSGYKDTKNAHFFGYYEGAKGVSGDYFDYQDLDGRYYAIIKCDVAGKGIPAALIMIQVATMFLNYFKQWKPTAKGMHIEEVVYQINDFIETLGFKGRFAAFTLCLFDSQTGILRFCNAGDNIIHLFDASEKQVKTIYLRETPATGVLPNVLVESKGGYKVETLTIDPGDILLLYTDGIEEAKRRFRDSEFREIFCTEGPNDTPHENHSAGQGDEEMGANRVQAIINAVMNRQLYTLHKWHNPEATASAAEDSKDLSFDFTACEGKVEEVIMALVSVEKMFRCYKDPKATDDNRVLVDKKVDEFLKVHFLQYRNYCSYTRENPGNDAYMYYTHVREDDQYDDLTILGIKRK